MEEMATHYEDTRSNTFFNQLINLKQKGSVTEHIENFQRLHIKVIDIQVMIADGGTMNCSRK